MPDGSARNAVLRMSLTLPKPLILRTEAAKPAMAGLPIGPVIVQVVPSVTLSSGPRSVSTPSVCRPTMRAEIPSATLFVPKPANSSPKGKSTRSESGSSDGAGRSGLRASPPPPQATSTLVTSANDMLSSFVFIYSPPGEPCLIHDCERSNFRST